MRLLHHLLVACHQTCTTDFRHVSGWQWGCQSTILYFIRLQRERMENNRKLSIFFFSWTAIFSTQRSHAVNPFFFFFHSAAFPFIYFYSMWSNLIHSNKLLFTHHMVIYNSSPELLVPPLTQFEQNISDSERYHGRSRTMTDVKVDPQLLPPSPSILSFFRSAFQTSWRKWWRVLGPGATSPTWVMAFTPTWTRRTWAPLSKPCTNTLNRWTSSRKEGCLCEESV